MQIELTFEGDLDERGWVQDFGGLKDVKLFLERHFDHKTIVAMDDPEFSVFASLRDRGIIDLVTMPAVGCEKFAEFIYTIVSESHPKLKSVKVSEHAGNSATVIRKEAR